MKLLTAREQKAHSALGRYDEALSAYEQARKLDAAYGPAYMEASKALMHLGRRQEAQQAYERARQLGYDEE